MSILRRLWPRRQATASITMGVHAVEVPRPIPLVEREPVPEDCDERGRCWFWDPATDPGIDDGVPSWELSEQEPWHTHWLPANVKVLPTRCCLPEVES